MSIKQPKWKTPIYKKSEVNDAGNTMRKRVETLSEITHAIDVIDNWRASHAYPMHVFYINLRRIAGERKDVVVAERLKRLDSIIAKLQRETDMNLWRMNDLGGCRIVFPTVDEVRYQVERFQKSRIRHEFIRKYDYIENPKPDGYRSIHLVYKFFSDTPGKEIYNHNMRIELQFRTHLQHIWATALETMGIYTKQAIKAGEGSPDVRRFFVLVSALFAIHEGCPTVPGTVSDEVELISEIEQINDQYHVLDKLKAIRVTISRQNENTLDKKGYYILQLNYEENTLRIYYFLPSEAELANNVYVSMEKGSKDKSWDVVLVRATSFNVLKRAYPNYFMDIGEFIEIVTEYLR